MRVTGNTTTDKHFDRKVLTIVIWISAV